MGSRQSEQGPQTAGGEHAGGEITTEDAAALNRHTWDSIRRQRDEGLIPKNVDIAADILAGKTARSPEQLALLGDVRGKRLLDLGCGDGKELLEFARDGAEVVGIDNSPRQLAAAQRAAETLGLSCRLALADLLRLPDDLLRGGFDVVFSSHVTAWIGDIGAWFAGAHRALKPGGVFLLMGGHPLSGYFGDVQRGGTYRRTYFEPGPFVFESKGASREWNLAGDRRTAVEWRHTLGDIVTAIAHAGFRITDLVERGDSAPKTGLPSGYPGEFIVRAVKEERR
jgi:SAM-dependent methyltransferase